MLNNLPVVTPPLSLSNILDWYVSGSPKKNNAICSPVCPRMGRSDCQRSNIFASNRNQCWPPKKRWCFRTIILDQLAMKKCKSPKTPRCLILFWLGTWRFYEVLFHGTPAISPRSFLKLGCASPVRNSDNAMCEQRRSCTWTLRWHGHL